MSGGKIGAKLKKIWVCGIHQNQTSWAKNTQFRGEKIVLFLFWLQIYQTHIFSKQFMLFCRETNLHTFKETFTPKYTKPKHFDHYSHLWLSSACSV